MNKQESDAHYEDIVRRAAEVGLERWDLMFRPDVCVWRKDWYALSVEYHEWQKNRSADVSQTI